MNLSTIITFTHIARLKFLAFSHILTAAFGTEGASQEGGVLRLGHMSRATTGGDNDTIAVNGVKWRIAPSIAQWEKTWRSLSV